MSKRRHQHADHEEGHAGGDERWLLTYADMITLLLALFILLFSVSTIDQKKYEALALGLRQTFSPKPGILPNSNGLLQNNSASPASGKVVSQLQKIDQLPNAHTAETTVPAETTTTLASGNASIPSSGKPLTAADSQQLASIDAQIKNNLAAQGLQNAVTTSIANGELTVQILADKAFFATDSADLGTKGNEVVDAVAKVLSKYSNLVDVNGYTDNAAITGGPFNSNEELSAERAVNVVLRLSRVDGIASDRLAATGFGQSHPAAPNDNPADMALNRRIDIVVLAQSQSLP